MELIEGPELAQICSSWRERAGRPVGRVELAAGANLRLLAGALPGEQPLTAPTTPPAPEDADSATPPASRTSRGGRAGLRRRVVQILIDVAEATHALHEAGVVHRDVKPGNI